MTPKEKIAMLFGVMDIWEIMSIAFLHKDRKAVSQKKDFVIDNALKTLAPNMPLEEIMEYHKELREEGVIDYLTGLLKHKYTLDQMKRYLAKNNYALDSLR